MSRLLPCRWNGNSCRFRLLVLEPDAGVRTVKHPQPVQRGGVAVDADPEPQLGPRGVKASRDAVDAEALLGPVVGGREEGAEASVGVELGDHPGGGPVGEGSRRPCLWGGHQPVGAPVPTHGEEPLGGRGGLEPAQPRREEAPRDGAVGEFHPHGHGSAPAHRAGDDRTRATRWALRDWT